MIYLFEKIDPLLLFDFLQTGGLATIGLILFTLFLPMCLTYALLQLSKEDLKKDLEKGQTLNPILWVLCIFLDLGCKVYILALIALVWFSFELFLTFEFNFSLYQAVSSVLALALIYGLASLGAKSRHDFWKNKFEPERIV